MINGVKLKKLRSIPDERGMVMELLRSDEESFQKFGQVCLSTVYPGVVKGWHYHKVQTGDFAIVRGMAKVALHDDRDGSPTRGEPAEFFIGEQNPALLKIPPMGLPGMKGIGAEPAYVTNYPTEPYDPAHPDEYRRPPDDPAIPCDRRRKEG